MLSHESDTSAEALSLEVDAPRDESKHMRGSSTPP
jgi:hypothetical protein